MVGLKQFTKEHNMKLWEKIAYAYPEINETEDFCAKLITLQDDGDGVGAYIRKWEYPKPIPDGLTLGKPKK
jgi:hypothetical protein